MPADARSLPSDAEPDGYDEATRRRIDRCGPPARPTAGPGRRAIGGGALLGAVALGLQDGLVPRAVEPIVEEIDAEPEEAAAVTLWLVRGLPHRSRALVRPWLLS